MSTLIPAKWHVDDFQALCENSEIRESVTKRLLELGLPSAKMEHYRYFSIVPLLSKTYRPVKQSVQSIAEGDEILIRDGEVISAPDTVSISIQAASEIDESHYDPIYYISHALTPKTIKLTVSQDVATTLRHTFTKEEALFGYRVMIEVAEDTKLQLDEIYERDTTPDSLALCGMDIHLKKGSSMTWVRDQESEADGIAMIASHAVRLDERSSMKLGSFDFGSSRILHIYKIDLGNHATLDAAHLLYGDGEGQRGNILQINHNGEHATTTQNAKHILKEKARGIFDALIRVAHAGKYAVTHQNARSVLLNNGAYMVSKPQLEIYIDELEASHGSTTGQLDPAQIFYLRSRGISEAEARKMLIFAFAKDVIETLGIEAIEERLIAKFEKRYTGGAA